MGKNISIEEEQDEIVDMSEDDNQMELEEVKIEEINGNDNGDFEITKEETKEQVAEMVEHEINTQALNEEKIGSNNIDFSKNFAFCDYGIDRTFYFRVFIQLFMFGLFIPFTMIMQQICDLKVSPVLSGFDFMHHFLHLNDFLLWFIKVLCLNICHRNRKRIKQWDKPANVEIREQKKSYLILRAVNWIFISVLWLWLFQITWIVIDDDHNDVDIMLYTQNLYMFMMFIAGCIVFGLKYGYQAHLLTEYALYEKNLASHDFSVGVHGEEVINLLQFELKLNKKRLLRAKSAFKRRLFVLVYAIVSVIATLYAINFDVNNIKLDYYHINIVGLCSCNMLFVVVFCEGFSRITTHSISLCVEVLNNTTMMLSPFWAKKYDVPLLYLQHGDNFRSWLELRGYYIYKVSEWTSRTECFILILSLSWMLLVGIAFFKIFFNEQTIWIQHLPWVTIIIWLLLNAYFILAFIKIAMRFEKLQKKQIQFIVTQQTFYINNGNDSNVRIEQKFTNIKEFVLQKTIIPRPFGMAMTGLTWKVVLGTIISALPTAIRYLSD
eukprot:123639_1